jgi:hypothetical protein
MSAAPRTVSTAPDLRSLGLALGAVLVAIAIVAVVAFARPTSTTAPSVAAAPAANFDHGTSSVPVFSASQLDHGTSSATSSRSTVIPYQAVQRGVTVSGTRGGGVLYTGIPSTTPDSAPNGGRGTRIAQ